MILNELNDLELRIRLLELQTIIILSLLEIFEIYEKNTDYQLKINNIINRVLTLILDKK